MFSLSDYNKDLVCYDTSSESCNAKNVNWGIDLGNTIAVFCFSFIPLGMFYYMFKTRNGETSFSVTPLSETNFRSSLLSE